MSVTVRSLHTYPVKGCAAVDVNRLSFDDDGLIVGDRMAMIVDAATGVFISQRHVPKLAKLRASWDGPRALTLATDGGKVSLSLDAPGMSRRVTVWDDTFDANDLGDAAAAFLSDWLGQAARLVALPERSPRIIDAYWAGENVRSSFADLAPVLVTSTSSLADLNARRVEAGQSPVEMARFRPNVVIDQLPAWTEDEVESVHLVGKRAGLRFIKPCARCKVIELDPKDGSATGDAVLSSLAKFRAGKNRRGTSGVFFGQNAVVTGGGGWGLSVGESLSVERSPIC